MNPLQGLGQVQACLGLDLQHPADFVLTFPLASVQHFLQRFPPGADRFAGVDTFEANNGAPALSEAIAYIECKVKSRMETNDHWITYAEVTSGGLTDADAKTAVHRRKVANYY